jgi:hypothetical protein
MGIFKRLDLQPEQLANYDPRMQEIIIKKHVINDIKPVETIGLIDKANVICSQILNIENEVEEQGLAYTDYGGAYYYLAKDARGTEYSNKSKKATAILQGQGN